MRDTYKITERNKQHEPLKIHVINVDDNPRGGWYRQIGAAEGMINRSLNRWCNHWLYCPRPNGKPVRNGVLRFGRTDMLDGRWCGEEITIPEVHHDSVWDFFDSIGYNHKDKRVSNTDAKLIIDVTGE